MNERSELPTEFSVGDRVLVSGVVDRMHDFGLVEVVTSTGSCRDFPPGDLRPDTGGRDLTATDVESALGNYLEDLTYWHVADRLNRIARGDAGSAGDEACTWAHPAECPVHGRVQDAIEQRLRDAGAGYEDEPWFADVIDGAADAAVRAAAGPRAGDTAPPTATAPWTVTLGWTPDQHFGRVSVMPRRAPLFAVFGALNGGETVMSTACEYGLSVEAVEVIDRLRRELAEVDDERRDQARAGATTPDDKCGHEGMIGEISDAAGENPGPQWLTSVVHLIGYGRLWHDIRRSWPGPVGELHKAHVEGHACPYPGELDRLRSEVAALRDAGNSDEHRRRDLDRPHPSIPDLTIPNENAARNVLAAATSDLYGWLPMSVRYGAAEAALVEVQEWIDAWRSAAGEAQ